MDNIYNIATYIINSPIYVDHLKLQKLLYYSEAVSLFLHNKSLFGEHIEAWKYGPVVKEIYSKYKTFGQDELPKDADFTMPRREAVIAIDTALSLYGELSGVDLIAKTHREDPWIDAFSKGEGTIIPREAIQEYYKNIYTYE